MMHDEQSYTAEGLIGVALLHSEWAHAIFYCEDAGYEAIYERLFKKIAPRVKSFVVACTGGKSIARKLGTRREEIPIPSVLIVDKDYDDLLGHYQGNTDLGLIYLRKYSLENYLSEVNALTEVAIEVLAKDNIPNNRYKLEAKIDDKNTYITKLASELTSIGRRFVVAQRYRLSVRTCKTPAEKLFPHEGDLFPLPTGWLEGFEVNFRNSIEIEQEWLLEGDRLAQELASAFETDCQPWGRLEDSDHAVGKHFLYGLLTYFDSRLGTQLRVMPSKELYLRLLSHADLTALDYLRDGIYSELKGTSALA